MADRTNEIYEIMDRCGLVSSNILTAKQSTEKTVGQIRLKLAQELNAYLEKQLAVEEGEVQ